jgi:DNA-binding response OmpR family regulator
MGQQPAILLIEDETRLRQHLQILLQSEGYHIVTAADGAEGIQKAYAQAFDLVITDLVMPEMDGFQVMECVQDRCPDTVLLAITGYASTESAIQALRRGAYDYIAKPFDVDLLLVSIKRALEKARLQRAHRHYIGELEQRVAERTHQLTEAKNNLEQALATLKATQEQLIHTAKLHAMEEATAAVAHELADPLTIIVSMARSLAKGVVSEGRMKTQLKQISEAAFCCQQIVQSFFTFVEAKASFNTMVCHIDLSTILLQGQLGQDLHKSIADPASSNGSLSNSHSNVCQAITARARCSGRYEYVGQIKPGVSMIISAHVLRLM